MSDFSPVVGTLASRNADAAGTVTFKATDGSVGGFVKIFPGGGGNAGYIEINGPDEVRLGYIGFVAGKVAFTADGANPILLDADYVQGKTRTVAQLPAAATAGAGARAFVSDANATTFASVVAGGGANPVPVYCDGTDWRIG